MRMLVTKISPSPPLLAILACAVYQFDNALIYPALQTSTQDQALLLPQAPQMVS